LFFAFVVCHTVAPLAGNGEAALRGGGFTNVPAGYKLPNSHCRFCGANAAILLNRLLCAAIFIA